MNFSKSYKKPTNLIFPLSFFFFSSDYYDDLDKSNQLMSLENVSIGDFGVAKYSEDNRWYRARLIMREGHEQIKIVFVDFGNIEIKSIKDFFPLYKSFTDLPAQAIACSLSEVCRKLWVFFFERLSSIVFARLFLDIKMKMNQCGPMRQLKYLKKK